VIDLIVNGSTRSTVGSTLFSLLSLVTLIGCALGPKQIGDLGDESGDEAGDGDQTGEGDGDGDGDGNQTGDGDGEGDECAGPFESPAAVDPDCDEVPIPCDNAPEQYNPTQGDQDLDGFGDIADLCPLTPDMVNTGDSDKDGIGNNCDTCRQTIDQYNLDEAMVDDPRMWVRNVPAQGDFDQDGIGDVCDNCVTVANCGAFDLQNPHTVGDPVPYEDLQACQTDTNSDMIGEACIDVEDPNAAGPVGFEADDDFDQDGIINAEDWCPRQPTSHEWEGGMTSQCNNDVDCNPNSESNTVCAPTPANNGSRYCNHRDADGDQVGDACDTCAYNANPMQVTDAGMQIDDEDGDFVSATCETNSACNIRKDPRPFTFMEVSFAGMCCMTMYPGDGAYAQDMQGNWDCEGLCDPYGFPITRGCADEADPSVDVPDGSKCRLLPPQVAALPGMLELPPECEGALEEAMLCAPSPANDYSCDELPLDQINRTLTLAHIGDDDLLWSKMCSLPQLDQDFDGLGDACDLCPFAFDPTNEPYVDDLGQLWENAGEACSGENQDKHGANCPLY
jgi:hypothetical protein